MESQTLNIDTKFDYNAKNMDKGNESRNNKGPLRDSESEDLNIPQ